MPELSVGQEALIRRIAGRILRSSEIQSAARYQALVTAGTIAYKAASEAYDAAGVEQNAQSYVKHRIHFAMFDALRRFETAERPAVAA